MPFETPKTIKIPNLIDNKLLSKIKSIFTVARIFLQLIFFNKQPLYLFPTYNQLTMLKHFFVASKAKNPSIKAPVGRYPNFYVLDEQIGLLTKHHRKYHKSTEL